MSVKSPEVNGRRQAKKKKGKKVPEIEAIFL